MPPILSLYKQRFSQGESMNVLEEMWMDGFENPKTPYHRIWLINVLSYS